MTTALAEKNAADLERLFADADALEDGSFDSIYHHLKPALTGFARRQGARDPEGVADLALFDGFKVFDRMRSRSAASFRAYVYRAARSHIVAEHRRSTVPTIPLSPTIDRATPDPDPDDAVDGLFVDSLLTHLTPDQRDVIECRFLQDMTAPATAELLGKSTNAVEQLQHRAIIRLRRIVFGGTIMALIVGAVWVLLQLSNPEARIDKRPVDRPEISEPPSETPIGGDDSSQSIEGGIVEFPGPQTDESSDPQDARPRVPGSGPIAQRAPDPPAQTTAGAAEPDKSVVKIDEQSAELWGKADPGDIENTGAEEAKLLGKRAYKLAEAEREAAKTERKEAKKLAEAEREAAKTERGKAKADSRPGGLH